MWCNVLLSLVFCQLMGTMSLEVVYSGYVIDNLCYDRVSSGQNALDGTDVILRPQDHTVHCLRDIPGCIASGFYLAYRCPDGSYRPRFQLDETVSHDNILALIQSTGSNAGLLATVTGEANGGSIVGGTVVQCTGSECDGACSGDCGDTAGLCEDRGSHAPSFTNGWLPFVVAGMGSLLHLLV
mmetsp:Transcript_3531/g.8792  ORF Transcript_3531/g.8792 Transcript_3531/m.8792 type:complete len:183 (+) Transcript_3531:111-659(+)